MKKILCCIICLVLAFSLFACATQTEEDQKTDTGSDKNTDQKVKDGSTENEHYIYVSVLDNLEYFYDHRLGLELAGEAFGVKTEYISQPGLDVNKQVEQLEQAIAKKPSGIITFGSDDGLIPVINKAVDEGIPVVTVDADIPKSKRTTYVGTGNYNAGLTGGEKLAELIGKKGKIAILTIPGQPNLEPRVQGYRDALAKYPDIEMVQIGDTKNDEIQAVKTTAEILQKHPDLSGVASVEAAGGIGIQIALKEAGKVGKVKVVAMDRSTQVLSAIKDGVIDATVVQQTQLMPFYAVQIMRNLKHNALPISSDNQKAGITGAPYSVDTGTVIVDKNNFEYFVRDN